MEIKKIRDLSLISIGDNKKMVIDCDNCGGIGMKAMDELKVPPFYVGRFTTRVALLEVLSTGAEVITITNTIYNEMELTGNNIIKGILEEFKKRLKRYNPYRKAVPTLADKSAIGSTTEVDLTINSLASKDLLNAI
ncbi:MAG TPA: hypothetical protein VIK78_21985 [Ruminiclostridium sp.]